MLKRGFDIVFSFIGLLTLVPIFAYIGTKIKAEDGGPIFYRGIRSGRNGEPFRIYKFRTMIVDAEKLKIYSTSDDDPRITNLGRILRKYKLDELPQLINVFKGEMSFVGPRPEIINYTDLYTAQERAILSLSPGITDLATIWNSDEGALLKDSKNPDKDYLEKIRPEKIRLQLEYVKNQTFAKDLKIILLTIGIIISKAVRKLEST